MTRPNSPPILVIVMALALCTLLAIVAIVERRAWGVSNVSHSLRSPGLSPISAAGRSDDLRTGRADADPEVSGARHHQ
jgi:hypothetical protein